jgi:hypothetical protein
MLRKPRAIEGLKPACTNEIELAATASRNALI